MAWYTSCPWEPTVNLVQASVFGFYSHSRELHSLSGQPPIQPTSQLTGCAPSDPGWPPVSATSLVPCQAQWPHPAPHPASCPPHPPLAQPIILTTFPVLVGHYLVLMLPNVVFRWHWPLLFNCLAGRQPSDCLAGWWPSNCLAGWRLPNFRRHHPHRPVCRGDPLLPHTWFPHVCPCVCQVVLPQLQAGSFFKSIISGSIKMLKMCKYSWR